MPTRGFGNPDVAGAFSRAAEICEDVGDPEGLFVALRGQGQYHMISGDLHTAQGHVTRIMDIAEGLEDDSALIEAHHLGWSTLCFTGDFEAARQHAREVIARYEPERHHRLTYTYSGHDPGMCCRVFGSLASWQLGYPDEAIDISRQGIALARSLARPFTVAISLWGIGLLYTLRRETGAMRETGVELIAYCAEKGIPPMAPMGRIFNGGAMAEDGELAEGVAEMRAGLAVL